VLFAKQSKLDCRGRKRLATTNKKVMGSGLTHAGVA